MPVEVLRAQPLDWRSKVQTTFRMQMQASVNTIPTRPVTLFPDEIIFYILHFLNPREVIRLRQVGSVVSHTFVGRRRPL